MLCSMALPCYMLYHTILYYNILYYTILWRIVVSQPRAEASTPRLLEEEIGPSFRVAEEIFQGLGVVQCNQVTESSLLCCIGQSFVRAVQPRLHAVSYIMNTILEVCAVIIECCAFSEVRFWHQLVLNRISSLCKRRGPFAGVRIGEASHPGPSANQAKMLIEMLLIIVTQFLGNDVAHQLRAVLKRPGLAKARRTKRKFRKPMGAQASSANADAPVAPPEQPATPPRKVTLNDPAVVSAKPQPIPKPWILRKQDWPDSKFLALPRLVDLYEDDASSISPSVLLLTDVKDWHLLHTMLHGSRAVPVTIVIHSDVELHHPLAHDANALEVATGVQVPFAQGNAVQLRSCTVVRMSSAAPVIKWKPLAKAVSSKEKAGDSVVLKCKADRRFCESDSWPKVSDKPGAAARFWPRVRGLSRLMLLTPGTGSCVLVSKAAALQFRV